MLPNRLATPILVIPRNTLLLYITRLWQFARIYQSAAQWSSPVVRGISFLLISSITLAAYRPSFHHFARADMFMYTATTAGQNEALQLIKNFYSFNRVNIVLDADGRRGDLHLFRPIYYAALGIEKALFGYQFRYWQITGVMVHLLLVWFLLGFLLEIRSSLFAPILALFFSTLFIGEELVTWQVLTPYIIGLIFGLLAFRSAYRYVFRNYRGHFHLLGASLFLLLAAFTYEITIAFGVVIVAFVLCAKTMNSDESFESMSRPQSWYLEAAALLAPAVVYLTANYLDSLRWNVPLETGIKTFAPVKAVKMGVELVFAYWYGGLFPLLQRVVPGDRLEWGAATDGHLTTLVVIAVRQWIGTIAGVMLTILGVYGIIQGTCRMICRRNEISSEAFVEARDRRLVGCAAFGVSVTVVAAVVIGRALPRGLPYVWACLHYPYIVWLFSIVGIYCIFDSLAFQSFNAVGKRYVKFAAAVGITVLSAVNATQVYRINLELQRLLTPRRSLADQFKQFIALHISEPDFSLGVLHHPPADEYLPWVRIAGGAKSDYYISDMLYREYMSASPKYYVDTYLDGPVTQIMFRKAIDGVPVGARQSYRGFNITVVDNKVYGLALSEGELDLRRAMEGGYRRLMVKSSIPDIRTDIDQLWMPLRFDGNTR